MYTCKKAALVALLLLIGACQPPNDNNPPSTSSTTTINAASANTFLEQAEKNLAAASEFSFRASWLANNFITVDSQFIETRAKREYLLLAVKYASEAVKFDALELDKQTRRKLERLKQGFVFPAPADAKLANELASISSTMRAMYGKGQYCNKQRCYSLEDMVEIMATSRDAELLKELWLGWRTVSPPMRPMYQRQVELANEGARQLGYDNLSVLWRSQYDMSADAFSEDIDRQWSNVKPLYDALHCHVRAKLNEYYGDDIVPATGKIPAHLLSNMWAQTWGDLFDLVKPGSNKRSYDLTRLIEQSGMSEIDMVKTGEAFFTSLGFEKLPETFWQRSLFVKPRDREVVCHASAWNLDRRDDLRIKMCIKKNADEFRTVHHELGHNFYQRAYKDQPYLFQSGANDGFHEAIGDVIALSITPSYLVQLGLLQQEPSEQHDLDFLMSMALEKIAFLPFGLLMDKWRWQVFTGETGPDQYNESWWALREKFQGIAAPAVRSEAHFDPGAKFHIPGNTPYMRYFLATIQQFQFHRALCKTADYQGPLHRCSIYNNAKAGASLNTMMQMGASKPWQQAMQAITGQPELDASALIDYFAPLKKWLDTQNQSRQCGW